MKINEIINEVSPIQIQQGPDISPELRSYKERGTRDAFMPDQRELGAQDVLGGGAPRVKNIVAKSDLKYGEPTDMFKGRSPASDKDITYAQRKVSQQELDDIRSLGYAMPPVAGTKYSQSDKPTKWWSPADDQGQFGRNWAKGDATVRIPTDKLSPKRAASRDDMEVQDPRTGEWHSMSLKDTPQARYASQWEKTKQNIPGMKSTTTKSEPTTALDAARQNFMQDKGRLPVQGGYPGDYSGIGQKDTERLGNLVKGYEKLYPTKR